MLTFATTTPYQNRFKTSNATNTKEKLSAQEAFVAASSIDVSARVQGVKSLVSSLSSSSSSSSLTTDANGTENENETLDLLITLLTNPSESSSVIDAIYDSSTSSLLAQSLAREGQGERGALKRYVKTLGEKVFGSGGVDKEVLERHLEFILGDLSPLVQNNDGDVQEEILSKILFPPFAVYETEP